MLRARDHRRRRACAFGTVRVTNQVVSFVRKLVSHERGRSTRMPLPAAAGDPGDTKAVWWTIPPAVIDRAGVEPARPAPAPSTRPSTPRSGCCRSSPRATDGTSAASRRRCTPTPACARSSSTTAIRAAPASPSAGSATPSDGSTATLEAIRAVPVLARVPALRAVPEVRQRQRAAGQAGGDRAAGCDTRAGHGDEAATRAPTGRAMTEAPPWIPTCRDRRRERHGVGARDRRAGRAPPRRRRARPRVRRARRRDERRGPWLPSGGRRLDRHPAGRRPLTGASRTSRWRSRPVSARRATRSIARTVRRRDRHRRRVTARCREIALALKMGKPVIGLGTWELGRDDLARDPIVRAESPAEAIVRLRDLVQLPY